MPASVVLGIGEDLSFTMDFNLDPGDLPDLPDLSADAAPGGEAPASAPEAEGPGAAPEADPEAGKE